MSFHPCDKWSTARIGTRSTIVCHFNEQFICYISNRSELIAYADDVSIIHFVSGDEVDETQLELNNIQTWSQNKGFLINEQKSKNIVLHRRSVEPILSELQANNSSIERVSSINILGITFQSNLKWDHHISSVIKKCNKSLGIIRKLSCSGVGPSDCWKVYLAICYSYMCYGFPVFCDITKRQLADLTRIEKRAMRICTKPTSDTNALIRRLEKSCVKLNLKISMDFTNHPLSIFYFQRELHFRLRHSSKMSPIQFSSKLTRNSFLKYYKY